MLWQIIGVLHMLFNVRVLEQLAGFSQEAFLQLSPVIAQLLSDAPKQIKQFELYYQQQNLKALEQLLHKLRGSYATLGAMKLPELSIQLEQLLHQQAQLPSRELFQNYLNCLEQTTAVLAEWLSQVDDSSAKELPDVLRFIHFLESNDMQAYSLFQQHKAAWQFYLGEDFVQMEQDMMSLNFAAVAERLKAKTQSLMIQENENKDPI